MPDEAYVSVLYAMALADLGFAPDRPLHQAETDELMRCLREDTDPKEAALELIELALIIRSDGQEQMAASMIEVAERSVSRTELQHAVDLNDDDTARTQARFRNFEGRPQPVVHTPDDEPGSHTPATLKPFFKA